MKFISSWRDNRDYYSFETQPISNKETRNSAPKISVDDLEFEEDEPVPLPAKIILPTIKSKRMPPKPIGDTYDPTLNITECYLPPQPQKFGIKRRTNRSLSGPINSESSSDFIDLSNDSLLAPFFSDQSNEKPSSNLQGKPHISVNTPTPFYPPSPRTRERSQSLRPKHGPYLSPFDLNSKSPITPSLVYFPIGSNIQVPNFLNKHPWKYPSGNRRGTYQCKDFQNFLVSITK